MAQFSGQEWDLWYPKAAATGIPFSRGRIAGADMILVHAAPPVLTVTVRAGDGTLLAQGKDLEATADTPIARLTKDGDQVKRTDIWPTAADIGQLVLLPGGEVGTLLDWWHAADHTEWRWQMELYNHR